MLEGLVFDAEITEMVFGDESGSKRAEKSEVGEIAEVFPYGEEIWMENG